MSRFKVLGRSRFHFLFGLSAATGTAVAGSLASSRSAIIAAKAVARNITIENRASAMTVSLHSLERHPPRKSSTHCVPLYRGRSETILNVVFIQHSFSH